MKIRLCLATTAAVLSMAAVSFPAQATLIPYTFSPDASMTFPAPTSDVIQFSGHFTVDTTSNILQDVSITASCTGPNCPHPLFNQPTIYTEGNFFLSATDISIGIPNQPDFALIPFASALTTPGTHDLVVSDQQMVPAAIDQVSATSVSGDVAPIPEPSSLALLTGVLSLFLLTRRAHRPNRAA